MSAQNASLDVIGIGNAIVDVLGQVGDDFIDHQKLIKGSMELIDESRRNALYESFPASIERSGGSAANTMVGAAALGSRTGYIGKIRDDQVGAIFAHDIGAAGVAFTTPKNPEGPASGLCLIAVTPDGERTMNTYLGASVELTPADVDEAQVASASVLYLEGYLWDPPSAKDAMREAVAIAHEAGRKVSLSLSDSFCVDRHREEFQALISDGVDILFANEDEAKALYENDDLEATFATLSGECEIAAITRGREGSTIVAGAGRDEVPIVDVPQRVDTTGAGDLYAAGFLHGLTAGRPLAECGLIGSVAAAEVIGHIGARPDADLKALVAERLH